MARGLLTYLECLLYWAPVNPITAATYFVPTQANNAFNLPYAMRALESHSIDVTSFYVLQIVQTLSYDSLGYVERFILETAKFSQLFAHRIIWNMKANSYKDEDSQILDPIKPTLDNSSGTDKSLYEREFSFFNDTSIPGKLRPYIKKSNNPDGIVIDIERKSYKSRQSHVKAPFMATFRISKKAIIFKVEDDCRQDMLALQLISVFRNIFNSAGLDVWVFPYRVTATAPGCGVIDVLPSLISTAMLGRDHEMGLYDYFINKNNFVNYMAVYSVILYLLKFKDRHNGNIMINGTGHIIHIDFGFCFDIAPGGIPFKLTTEMSCLRFEELCIKCFLACWTYIDKLTHCVVLMIKASRDRLLEEKYRLLLH
ncbi:kinase-like protein [Choiromyces venosus 120613-1]|uniref:1-phosphatidylinositol 4-kinase n=1 Tax=Choiromyces venosus 120613-1 TaxID=1336337 RepID=A0A3N4JQ82_9PEZI|nr:kinase-like protein [Choiromyces venosus 120613-1]